MRTFVYIDGYNFYYRSLKSTPHKWLDLGAFCKKLLPQNRILRINYYTARAKAQPLNPLVGVRQQEYLRALKTIPNLFIHFGQFRAHPVNQPLFDSIVYDDLLSKNLIPTQYLITNSNKPRVKFATVLKTEEKGSDVNLATHLVYDACNKEFDVAAVFSNDSDLAEPIKIVAKKMGLIVNVYNKDSCLPAKELKSVASNTYKYRNSDLLSAQFPATLIDKNGTPINKPAKW